ncbi:MAG: DUF305 domain-containing protein [Spirochaetota bacterium]|nr:DUF305 domain-containing protein [Spirochaetota bacterium]
MYKLLLLMILVYSNIIYSQDHNNHSMASEDNNSQKVMMLMHKPMMEQKYQQTDSPDVDFLVNMIPHHKGAVLSSEEYLKSGKNETVKKLAMDIITAQQKEILEFQQASEKLKTELGEYSKKEVSKITKESKKAMDQMMKEMSSITLSGDIDRDYLIGMLPHHQGAINVSQIILKVTTNETIKEIANRIIADQQKEIADIHKIIADM